MFPIKCSPSRQVQFDNITIKHAHSNTQKVIQYLQWFNQVLDYLLSNYSKMVTGGQGVTGVPLGV
jgi:hypothetical protein